MTNQETALLSLLPALLNAAIFYYVVFYFPKSRLTSIFSLIVFALMLWQVEDTILRLTPSVETARFWDGVFCIGWLGLAPLVFHFACKLASLKELTTRFALFMLYGPFFVLYVMYISKSDHTSFYMDPVWGWINLPRVGSFDGFQRFWISLVIIATVFILFQYAYRAGNNKDKKYQAWIIAIGILLPTLQGIITQVIFPLVLHKKEIPVTSSVMSLFSFVTILGINRYKLFQVSESIPVDTLMESLNKIILIISPSKKIIFMNQHARSVLGIKEDEVETTSFEKIFHSDGNHYQNYCEQVFTKVMKHTSVHSHPSTFLNSENNKIEVLITSSCVINNNIVQGIMLVANDITEIVTAVKELEEERFLKEKAITNAVIDAQEKERKTLGIELHDNINQILASSILYLKMINPANGQSKVYLDEMEALIHLAIDEIRKLSHSLIAPSLNERELTAALDKIIAMAGKTGTVSVKKIIRNIDEESIPEQLKLNIYRIVQEQFNNIMKYAQAKNIRIKLIQKGKNLLLCIKDDGIGFDTSARSGGVGLTNIKTRAALYNGEMKIVSSPGKGCELNVSFDNLQFSKGSAA